MTLIPSWLFLAIGAITSAVNASPFSSKARKGLQMYSNSGVSTPPELSWSLKLTGSTQQFRGLSPVSDRIIWVSGTNSTVLRSTDGGDTWDSVGPSLSGNDSTLEFRDIQAWSARRAAILSIGEATNSRIYLTEDGGETWIQSFTNQEAAAFYDCFAFENPEHGIAMSDPVDGKFRLIESFDGGKTWNIVDSGGMPPALDGEFGFAASGTCLEVASGRWYLASGGVDPGRIFRSCDGNHWEVSNSSIAGSTGGGVFSVRFRDARHGIALGGDYENPNLAVNNSAWSSDGGITWNKALVFPGGYRSGSSWIPGFGNAGLSVGPTGSDFTLDGGRTWHGFDNGTFDNVECVSDHVCWASGSKGRIARLVLK